MSYDIYRYIFVGGLVLSGVFLLATVAIFLLLNIKNVIGDLTGSNAKKGIENIRNHGAKAPGKKGEKKHSELQNGINDGVETSRISPQDRFDNLEVSQTEILSANDNEYSQTSVLSADLGNGKDAFARNELDSSNSIPANPNFIIETDITYVHSAEVIR